MDAKDELPNVPGLPPQPVPPAPAATPQNPVWIPQGPQVHTLAQLQSLLQYQQIYQASPWQQQMVIHIVCLTQRAEEHVFDKKIEVQHFHRASKELTSFHNLSRQFFWRGILENVLPLDEVSGPCEKSLTLRDLCSQEPRLSL